MLLLLIVNLSKQEFLELNFHEFYFSFLVLQVTCPWTCYQFMPSMWKGGRSRITQGITFHRTSLNSKKKDSDSSYYKKQPDFFHHSEFLELSVNRLPFLYFHRNKSNYVVTLYVRRIQPLSLSRCCQRHHMKMYLLHLRL